MLTKRKIARFLYNKKIAIKTLYKRIKKEKINIVFVCHRPSIFGSLKTVFEACVKDEKFNATIVAIPVKSSNGTYKTEGAEVFFKNFPCRVINGYDYKTAKWFDLKELKPDYIFFQQPYNSFRPKDYASYRAGKYAKILYVHYAANILGKGVLEDTYPIDFMQDVSIIFTSDKYDNNLILDIIKKNKLSAKAILTGFPRYDEIEKFKNSESNNWNFYPKQTNKKRIIWTPRWCLNEGNCNFFEYKDKLIEYVKNNQDVDFIFRPHPQAFIEWRDKGLLNEVEELKYRNEYENLKNAKIDNKKEYLETFYSSDILITDISSIIAEYFLTGKPVIYCHKKDFFNDFSRELSKGFYWVKNWEELESAIKMLKSGNDPLYETRQKLIKENFYINPNGAGETIKEIIKKDFYGK